MEIRGDFWSVLTGMADTGVVDLYADFVCLWRGNLNLLNAQRLGGFPSYSSLWIDISIFEP